MDNRTVDRIAQGIEQTTGLNDREKFVVRRRLYGDTLKSIGLKMLTK